MMHSRILGTAIVAILSCAYGTARAQGQPQKIEYVNAEMGRLERYFGLWSVTERHFDELGRSVGVVKGREEVEWILKDHAIKRNYRTGTKPNVFEAIGLLTWNTAERKYRGVWMDNASTLGPTTVTGEWNPKTEVFVFTLDAVGQDGKKVRYRVIEKFDDDDTRHATTYALEGEQLIKRLEVQYKRALPCPDKMRKILPLGQ